jgi:hypothetical protein
MTGVALGLVNWSRPDPVIITVATGKLIVPEKDVDVFDGSAVKFPPSIALSVLMKVRIPEKNVCRTSTDRSVILDQSMVVEPVMLAMLLAPCSFYCHAAAIMAW